MKKKKIKGFLLVISSLGLLMSCSQNDSSDPTSTEPDSSQNQPETINLYGLKITHAPDKTTYKEGEAFDPTGMVVTATYDDLTSKAVTDYTVSPNGPLTFEDKKVTISYTEGGITKTATQAITVESATALDSISIKTPATKLEYAAGERFDPMGMEIEATYANGNKHVVTDYTFTPNGELTLEDTSITISYKEGGVTKTVSQPIQVVKAVLRNISIKTGPTKMTYNFGEDFDATGLTVEGQYSNGKTLPVSDFTVSPSGKLGINDTVVKVSVATEEGTKTAHLNTKITINAPEISEGDYEGAHELLFSNPNNYTLEGGASKSTWSSNPEKNVFDRLRCNSDVKKKITFEHDFSSLDDVSKAGFMSIMSDARGGTKIEISTDEKATWQTLSEAKEGYNMIPADYKYPCATIAGKPASDGNNKNVYYCYYDIGKFLSESAKKAYIRFSYEDPTDKGWLGIDKEGSDLIHSVTFYDRLYLSHVLGDITIRSLSIKQNPTKTSYYVGEKFDSTGLVLEATWSDGTVSDLTSGFQIDKNEGLSLEDTEIIISYGGVSTTLSISVTMPAGELTGIEITTNPTKTAYHVGDTFDPTGMVVSAVYGEDTKVVISDYTCSPDRALMLDDTKVTIAYEGQTAEVAITVTKIKIDEDDYVIAKTLDFNDENNYTLVGGAYKGTARQYKDNGSTAVRLRCKSDANSYIQIQYKYEDDVDLTNAGFMFTGLHQRLGTIVSMSTDGTNFTKIIEAKAGDKTISSEWEEFEDRIVSGANTDSNMYRMYNHLPGLTSGATVTLRFGYQTAPSGAVDKEGADIFGSVVFYSSLDLRKLSK